MSKSTQAEQTVEARDVTVRFGTNTAVDGISFTLNRGDVVGLVGPNGAGKTTLLRVLASLLPPDEGCASIHGFDVARQAVQVRRRIGYLPDFVGLYQDMRVVEYLRFFADANGLDRAGRERFVDSAIEMSELADRRDDFVEQLSKGMRGKLVFAATLAGDPSVLLLDEPLSGLDPLARASMRKNLARLGSENRTVLISSHMLEDLEKLCDRVLLIDRGRLFAELDESETEGALYELAVTGDLDGTVETLDALKPVESVTPGDRAGVFLVKLVGPDDGPDALARIVAADLAVLSWAPVTTTLEDRFRSALEEGRS